MKLTWIKTLHGASPDPQSGETGLKTIASDGANTVLDNKATWASYIALGVFKSGAENYLMIFNKDLVTPHDYTITLNSPRFDPHKFNKTTGQWESCIFSKKTLAFTVSTIGAGDMQLVRLNTDITPIINLLLGD